MKPTPHREMLSLILPRQPALAYLFLVRSPPHGMKYLTSIALIAVAICAKFANADPQTEQIRKLAAENSAALTSGNYARLVELTYPKVVEMIGGRDKMIETLRNGTEEMKAHGNAILGAEASEPKEVVPRGDSTSPSFL